MTEPRRTAWNSTLPAPSKPMPRGSGFAPRITGLQPSGPWSRPVPLLSASTAGGEAGRPERKPAARAETGFSRKVKLQVRTRAGRGDPDLALCEACGLWLGRRHGQVHHRANRGSGGCADEVVNSCAGAALLCGTPFAGCHGLATALDPDMKARGFVVEHGTTPEYDIRNVSVLLASEHGSGIAVYLAQDGLGPDGTGYLTEPPAEAAA